METPQTLQKKLFHDSPEDAITTDVLAAGGYKKIGSHLRPDLTPEQAAAWLRACLNADRAEKLGPGHVLEIKRLAKTAGSEATVQYEAAQLGYQVEWIDPEDEQEQLDRDIRDLLQVVLKKQEQRERAQQRAHLRAAK